MSVMNNRKGEKEQRTDTVSPRSNEAVRANEKELVDLPKKNWINTFLCSIKFDQGDTRLAR